MFVMLINNFISQFLPHESNVDDERINQKFNFDFCSLIFKFSNIKYSKE